MKARLQRWLPYLWPYALLCVVAAPFVVLGVRLLREPDVHMRDRWALWLLALVPYLAWTRFSRDRHAGWTRRGESLDERFSTRN